MDPDTLFPLGMRSFYLHSAAKNAMHVSRAIIHFWLLHQVLTIFVYWSYFDHYHHQVAGMEYHYLVILPEVEDVSASDMIPGSSSNMEAEGV